MLLGCDHKFNPHVYVMSSLDQNEIERVRSGETVAPRSHASRHQSVYLDGGESEDAAASQHEARVLLVKSTSMPDIPSSDVSLPKSFSLIDMKTSQFWPTNPMPSEYPLHVIDGALGLEGLNLNHAASADEDKQSTLAGKSIWGDTLQTGILSSPPIWGDDHLDENCSFASSVDLNEAVHDLKHATTLLSSEADMNSEWALDKFAPSNSQNPKEATDNTFNDDAFLNEHRSIFNSSF